MPGQCKEDSLGLVTGEKGGKKFAQRKGRKDIPGRWTSKCKVWEIREQVGHFGVFQRAALTCSGFM